MKINDSTGKGWSRREIPRSWLAFEMDSLRTGFPARRQNSDSERLSLQAT